MAGDHVAGTGHCIILCHGEYLFPFYQPCPSLCLRTRPFASRRERSRVETFARPNLRFQRAAVDKSTTNRNVPSSGDFLPGGALSCLSQGTLPKCPESILRYLKRPVDHQPALKHLSTHGWNCSVFLLWIDRPVCNIHVERRK